MNGSTGKRLPMWVVPVTVIAAWFIGVVSAVATMPEDKPGLEFTKQELDEADTACRAMGGTLVAEFGTTDREIGKLIHLHCLPAKAASTPL